MLVVISDFHLADGTAGEHNLTPDVYENFIARVAEIHARVRQHKPDSRIEIVYAGDIFDMLRTHYWFTEAGEHKPWRHFQSVVKDQHADPPQVGQAPNYLEHAVQLFTKIMIHPDVSPIKGILGDKLADHFGGVEPIRTYIPGENDRLINMHSGLRARVIDFLGLDLGRPQPWNPELPFPNSYIEPSHGVFIRHGHEYDVYSFEARKNQEAQGYTRVPMSDLISCELFARLTYEASLLQPSEGVPVETIQFFRRELEQIDNVRPVSSVVKWLTRHFTDKTMQKLLQDCLGRAVTNFEAQDYVKWWLSASGHDDWYNPLDEADRLELLLSGLKKLWLGKIGAALKIYDKFATYDPYERYIERAEKEQMVSQIDAPVRYVVYGHTHHAQHVPLRVDRGEAGTQELHYINTGSMRPTHTVTHNGKDFNTTEALCFAVFFTADEKPNATGPSHELWNVTRSRLR